MNAIFKLTLSAVLAGVFACGGSVGIGVGGSGAGMSAGTAADTHRQEVEAWHRGRIERLTS